MHQPDPKIIVNYLKLNPGTAQEWGIWLQQKTEKYMNLNIVFKRIPKCQSLLVAFGLGNPSTSAPCNGEVRRVDPGYVWVGVYQFLCACVCVCVCLGAYMNVCVPVRVCVCVCVCV